MDSATKCAAELSFLFIARHTFLIQHYYAAATELERPRDTFRRGDWYARKETRRGDKKQLWRSSMGAPRLSVFALSLPFKMITSLPAV